MTLSHFGGITKCNGKLPTRKHTILNRMVTMKFIMDHHNINQRRPAIFWLGSEQGKIDVKNDDTKHFGIFWENPYACREWNPSYGLLHSEDEKVAVFCPFYWHFWFEIFDGERERTLAVTKITCFSVYCNQKWWGQ